MTFIRVLFVPIEVGSQTFLSIQTLSKVDFKGKKWIVDSFNLAEHIFTPSEVNFKAQIVFEFHGCNVLPISNMLFLVVFGLRAPIITLLWA